MAERSSSVIWSGGISDGSGKFTVGSGAFGPQDVSFARRIGEPEGVTSPEELIAAAHASCFSMAFSLVLEKNGTPPQELDVNARVAFGENAQGAPEVQYSKLSVTGKVAGIDAAKFDELAKAAEALCPVSNALRNNVPIELEAKLA